MSCLYTGLVEIYGERAERAVFRHAVRTYEYGNLRGIRHLDQSGNGRSDHVIRGNIDEIHLPYHGFRCLLNIIDGGNGPFHHSKAEGRRMGFRLVCLDLAVHFAGGINQSKTFRRGKELKSHIYLLLHRAAVIDAGHVRFRPAVRFYQFRRFKISNGAPDNGQVMNFIGYRLCGRCGNRADKIRTIGLETGRNSL